ncbi:MAG: hypothetical protein WD889_02860 [Candidatus Colwellbacteria bacterium]
MTTATYHKLKREIKKELLEELVYPLLERMKDQEGEYRPEFVREILKAAKEKPTHRYNSKTFAKLIS